MFFKKPQIKVLKTVPQKDVVWNAETLLFFVDNGKGLLRYASGRDPEGITQSFLLMNDIPLIKWQNGEYDCPTCEKLLAAGYGRDKLDHATVDLIKQIGNQINHPLHEVVQQITPLLHLLKTGIYALSYIKLIPTNGDGEFFWKLTNEQKSFKASCDTYYKSHYWDGYPAFLVPTQTTTKFDQDKVEEYRKLLKQGATLGGLAYYLDGYLCALLDGHHRATASFLEEKDFYCLTIMRANGICYDQQKNVDYFIIGGEVFHCTDFPPDIIEQVTKHFGDQKVTDEQVQNYQSLEQVQTIEVFPKEFDHLAQNYPDYLGLASVHWAGDISDQKIDQLFQKVEDDFEENLAIVFKALIATRDERTKDIALRIAKSEEWLALWFAAFQYLSTIQSQEIEDFFINFLIDDEKLRPELTKIADEYLMKR